MNNATKEPRYRDVQKAYDVFFGTTSVYWNPFNKVVCDHRDGTIVHLLTNMARAENSLPVPWTPEIGKKEVMIPAVYLERTKEDSRG